MNLKNIIKLFSAPVILGIILIIGKLLAVKNNWEDFYQVFIIPAIFPLGGIIGQYTFGCVILGLIIFGMDRIPSIKNRLYLGIPLATILFYLLYWLILYKLIMADGGF